MTKNTEPRGTFTEETYLKGRALGFAQYLQALVAWDGSPSNALEEFPTMFPKSAYLGEVKTSLELRRKANVDPGTSTSWASDLPGSLAAAFLALARRESLLGRIPGLRKVPANVPMPVTTSSGQGAWAGEGAPKPLSSLDFEQVTVPLRKALRFTIVSEEITRGAAGTAELLRDTMIADLALFIDRQLTDPAVTETANRPGSLTNGITPIATGTDLGTTVDALISAFFTNRPTATEPVFLASPGVVPGLSAAGYADARIDGSGTIAGIPLVASSGLGRRLVLIDAAANAWTGDDLPEVNYTRQATVQLSDNPDNPPTAATVQVSLWQRNLVGFRVEQFLGWKRGTTNAVQYAEWP